jgi:hypothetical protein
MTTASPICHCPDCNAVFPLSILKFDNVSGHAFQGIKTPCVNCGGVADLLDGTFNFVGDTVVLVEGPAFTVEIFRRFASLVEQANAGEITPEDLETEATKLGAEYGQLATKARKGGKRGIALLAVVAMAVLGRCNLNLDVDLNELYDQVAHPTAASAAKTP